MWQTSILLLSYSFKQCFSKSSAHTRSNSHSIHYLGSCMKWKSQDRTIDLLNQKRWAFKPSRWFWYTLKFEKPLASRSRPRSSDCNLLRYLCRLSNNIVFFNVPEFTCHLKEFVVCSPIWVIFLMSPATCQTASMQCVKLPIILSNRPPNINTLTFHNTPALLQKYLYLY